MNEGNNDKTEYFPVVLVGVFIAFINNIILSSLRRKGFILLILSHIQYLRQLGKELKAETWKQKEIQRQEKSAVYEFAYS